MYVKSSLTLNEGSILQKMAMFNDHGQLIHWTGQIAVVIRVAFVGCWGTLVTLFI